MGSPKHRQRNGEYKNNRKTNLGGNMVVVIFKSPFIVPATATLLQFLNCCPGKAMICRIKLCNEM